jgi:DNA polymerase-3 subunit beta
MKFSAARSSFLSALQAVTGVVEKRQTMPVLANVLLSVKDNVLTITGTDLEVELSSNTAVDCKVDGEITVPGRKLLDIVKALPEGAEISVALESDRAVVRSGKSRFSLSTLPASDFPSTENIDLKQIVKVDQRNYEGCWKRLSFLWRNKMSDIILTAYYLN